jgi:hypothetical protein
MEYPFRGRLLWILRPSRTKASGTLLLAALRLVAAPSFCAAPSWAGEQPVNLLTPFYGGKESPALVSGAVSQNMFDWRQTKRWGISMDEILAGSTVINREYTVWEFVQMANYGTLRSCHRRSGAAGCSHQGRP